MWKYAKTIIPLIASTLGGIMELTAENVKQVGMDCLFKDEEVPNGTNEEKLAWAKENGAVVEGIVGGFGFHKGRIAQHKGDIQSMLEQLPDEFRQDKGGGWSFLNMCVTKTGEQWGEHRDMELLACLAIAAGLGTWQGRGTLQEMMPGGVPYFAWGV